jgi:hypothetical protein
MKEVNERVIGKEERDNRRRWEINNSTLNFSGFFPLV